MSDLGRFSAPYKDNNKDNNNQYHKTDRIPKSIYDVDLDSSTKYKHKDTAVLVIDSATRNTDKYPEPNHYIVRLVKQYNDVVALELTSANIPNSGYIINTNNNTFYYQDTAEQVSSGDYYTVTISIGNWTIDEIVANLETAMNSASIGSGSIYDVTVDTHTNKITITQSSGTGIFNIVADGGTKNYTTPSVMTLVDGTQSTAVETITIYPPSALASVLGFRATNLTGSTFYTGSRTYDIKTDKYIILKIRDVERVDSITSALQDSFCVIPLDTSVNNFQFTVNWDDLDNNIYVKYFSTPKNLISLEITFLRPDGELFDFNGHDHLLTFQITSLSRNTTFGRGQRK